MQKIFADTVNEFRALKYTGSLLISKSDLILTAPITAGMSQAAFQVNATSGGAQNWEIRLQQTDLFKICRMGVYAYGLIGTSTGPAGTLSEKYWTYAPWELAKSFVAIAPLWDSGLLNMILNSVQYVKNWATNRHLSIPRTPMGPFQPLTTSGSANNASQANVMLGDDGMDDVEPTIMVNGAWANTINLTFNNALGFGPVTNFVFETDNADDVYININYINLRFEGLLCQNLSSILGPPGK